MFGYSAVSGYLHVLWCHRRRCPRAVVRHFEPRRDGAFERTSFLLVSLLRHVIKNKKQRKGALEDPCL